jgi:cell division protease FtsH
MGHALVACALPGSDVVHKVSIIPRGVGALGYTIQRPTEDRFLMQRGELMDKMAVLLGGRAAEVLVIGELSTGAADDLAKVTDIARTMVTQYGMEPSLGHLVYETPRSPWLATPQSPNEPLRYSEQTAQRIDVAVRELVSQAFERSLAILTAQRERLETGAARLLERETLGEDDLRELLREAPAGVPA